MRYLAIDFGLQRIGMAVSDESETLSTPHGTHRRDNAKNISRRDVAAIAGIVRGLGVQGLVFGLPRALDGRKGANEDAVRDFAAQLQNALREDGLDLPVEWWDERFSTREALGQMRDSGISQKRGREADGTASTDARAAAVILQGFLDSRALTRQRILDAQDFEDDSQAANAQAANAQAANAHVLETDEMNIDETSTNSRRAARGDVVAPKDLF